SAAATIARHSSAAARYESAVRPAGRTRCARSMSEASSDDGDGACRASGAAVEMKTKASTTGSATIERIMRLSYVRGRTDASTQGTVALAYACRRPALLRARLA